MIECGLPIAKLKRALNFELSTFRGCLLSHFHSDHSKAAADLLALGIALYCSSGTAEALGLSGHSLHVVEPYTVFGPAPWRCMAFPTEHDALGSLGFVVSDGVEKLLFCTDSYYIRPKFRGLNLIAIEVNWSESTIDPNIDPAVKRRLVESHMSLETALEFLRVTDLRRVREVHLLHLSDSNSDEEYFRREVARATGKPVFISPK